MRETVTLERRLTEPQSERRIRIRDAARELVAKDGYSAVTIREVAERARVARATVYRYYSSKDHLLADVIMEWAFEFFQSFDRERGHCIQIASLKTVGFGYFVGSFR